MPRHDRSWLRVTDPCDLELLWATADATRCRHLGDTVHLSTELLIRLPMDLGSRVPSLDDASGLLRWNGGDGLGEG